MPMSSRCQYCTRRKIKCDENWPTCGSCKRAKKNCSGPIKRLKFVHNGQSAFSSERDDVANESRLSGSSPNDPESSTTITLVETKQRKAEGGGSFHRMRICKIPQPCVGIEERVPSEKEHIGKSSTVELSYRTFQSTDDMLAARLVACLDECYGTGYQFVVDGETEWLRLIPNRIGECEALKDTISLVISCWNNIRRNVCPSEVMDYRAYGKALRSLQLALDDPQRQLSVQTYAATSLLAKAELYFDFQKGVNRLVHAGGVRTVMLHRGPPSIDDELDLMLSIECHSFMTVLHIRLGEDNFLAEPKWKSTFDVALKAGKVKPCIAKNILKIELLTVAWPSLVRMLRTIHDNPCAANVPFIAAEVLQQAQKIRQDLKNVEREVIIAMRRRGDIWEVKDDASPFGGRYWFRGWAYASVFRDHHCVGISMNRIMAEAHLFLGTSDLALEEDNLRLSQDVWKTIDFALSLRPLGAVDCMFTVCMSYESGGLIERAYIIDALKKIDAYKGEHGHAWMEPRILAACRALTGRLPFLNTQDVAVELRGEGARS